MKKLAIITLLITLSTVAFSQTNLDRLRLASLKTDTATATLDVGATQATGTITILTYAGLHLTEATPSDSLTFGTPDSGSTVVFLGPTGGPYTFMMTDTVRNANEFVDIIGLDTLLNNLVDVITSLNFDSTKILIDSVAIGADANSWTITVYDTTVITFSGGIDACVVTVGADTLIETEDWDATVSDSSTALSLKNAIDALSTVGASVAADDTVITITATQGGDEGNYTLTSSNTTDLTLSGSAMTGGVSNFEIVLERAPILDAIGNDVGGFGYKSFSATENVFLYEKRSAREVVSDGDYYINYYTGYIKVRTPNGIEADPVATWWIKVLQVATY